MKERRMHLDLSEADSMPENIQRFTEKLERRLSQRNASCAPGYSVPRRPKDALRLASSELIDLKLKDDQEFKIAHFAVTHSSLDSVLAAEELARRTPGIELHRSEHEGVIVVPERGIVVHYAPGLGTIFDAEGIEVPRREGLPYSHSGMDVLHFLSCLVEQDVAFVVKQGRALIYDFDASRHEKTPKDPRTGENYFVGRELIEFHNRGRTVGPQIAHTLQYVIGNFQAGTLDHLTVDLRGGNLYTNGEQTVRRFERDHFIPVYTKGRRPDGSDHFESMNTFVLKDEFKEPLGKLHGVLGYAEVFFQPATEKRSPFQGGVVVDVPLNFYQTFKVQR